MKKTMMLLWLVLFLSASHAATLEVSATVSSGGVLMDSNEMTVDVVDTREFTIAYKKVGILGYTGLTDEEFSKTVQLNDDFMKATYPIEKISSKIDNIPYFMLMDELAAKVLLDLYVQHALTGSSDERVIGVIAPEIMPHTAPGKAGFSFKFIPNAVIITPGITHVTAHEIGHTYGLCDEYSFCEWAKQDLLSQFTGGCPNSFPYNCPQATCIPLFPLNDCTSFGNNNINGFWVKLAEERTTNEWHEIYGFMGGSESMSGSCGSKSDTCRWTTKDIYKHLLTQFSTTPLSFSSNSFSLLGKEAYFSSSDQSLLLSGFADKNGEVILQDFYIMDSTQEQEIPTGDYSLKLLDSADNVLLDQSFGVSYTLLSDPPIDLNTTGFVFTVPFPEGTHKIKIDFNGTTRAERLVSLHAPTVSFTNPAGGEEWSTTQLVEWNASDLDNDALNFVLQYSTDNGLTWNPITIGLQEQSFELDAAALPPREQYKLKVIATDGVNTSQAISETFTVRNPKIEAEPWLIDFGETKQGAILQYDISLWNSGNQNLKIQDLQTTAQTTITGITTPTTLAPVQGVEFQLFLDTSGLEGNFDKTVLSIQSNAPKQEWKNIYAKGTIILPETIDGNLHLTGMNSYIKEREYYSGAATAKMILDYVRTATGYPQISQDKLQFYGNQNKDKNNQTLLDLDAKAMDAVLGHYDPYDNIINDEYDSYDDLNDGNPYQGYNYSIESYENTEEYMNEIIHWMAYPVTRKAWWKDSAKAAEPNTPAALPLYGSYSHWIALNGFAASQNPVPEPETNPWKTSPITIYGFWLTDPAQDGIGHHVYVTAADANAIYFKPMQTNDQYNGKLLQIAEPPPRPPQEMAAMPMGGARKMATITAMVTTTTMTTVPKATIAKPVPMLQNLETVKEMAEKAGN